MKKYWQITINRNGEHGVACGKKREAGINVVGDTKQEAINSKSERQSKSRIAFEFKIEKDMGREF